MIFASNNLPHEPLTRTFYELSRLQLFAAWWHWLLFLGACATVVAYVIFLYVRDGRELPRGLACALLLARLVALLGILLTFLNLEKRTERRLAALKTGDVVYVSPSEIHQFRNTGEVPLKFLCLVPHSASTQQATAAPECGNPESP